LTGLESDKDRNRAYAAGVADYLLKPVNVKSMYAIIAEWRDTLAN
jgi:DNA-binding response OmpR family regulator